MAQMKLIVVKNADFFFLLKYSMPVVKHAYDCISIKSIANVVFLYRVYSHSKISDCTFFASYDKWCDMNYMTGWPSTN